MAEDVLQLAGFVENVNYVKQKTLAAGSRPDFTFLLPRKLTLNMDVKFPLDNYLSIWMRHPTSTGRGTRQIFCGTSRRGSRKSPREITSILRRIP